MSKHNTLHGLEVLVDRLPAGPKKVKAADRLQKLQAAAKASSKK